MLQLGDPVTLAGRVMLVEADGEQRFGDGGVYSPLPGAEAVLEDAREWLLTAVKPQRASTIIGALPHPLGLLGAHAVAGTSLGAPMGCTIHRDLALPAHRDTQNPGPCANATVFFRAGVSGGWLVLDGDNIAVEGADGWRAVFDGQQLHGVTLMAPRPDAPVPYRLTASFYCPR